MLRPICFRLDRRKMAFLAEKKALPESGTLGDHVPDSGPITRCSETDRRPTESYRYHQLTLPTWTHPRGITGPYQILVSLKSDALRWPTDLSAGSWTAVSSGLEKGTSDTRGSRCRGSTTGHPLGEHHHKACPGIGHSKIRLCRFSGVCSWRS